MSASLRKLAIGTAASDRIRSPFHDLLRRYRFLRFLLTGALNTAVGYGLFLAALALLPNTLSALVASTVAAVLFNFLSTGTLVFASRDPWRLLPFVGVYGLVLGYNAVGLAWLEGLGIRPQLGGLALLPGAVAISWLLNSRFVFGRGA